MHDDTCESSLQAAWRRTMDKVRDKLDEMAEVLPAMKADEVTAFENLLWAAFNVSRRVESLDAEVELERARVTPREG